MDLLLASDVVAALCSANDSVEIPLKLAVARCQAAGHRVWLYVGAVASLRLRLTEALASYPQPVKEADRRLREFARDKQWLAALAGEGDVFDAEQPELEQLLRATQRFTPGTIALLTDDPEILQLDDARICSAEGYLARTLPAKSLDFIDLKTAQNGLRPQLEAGLHRVLLHGQYVMGPEMRELEERLAAYVGVKHCVTVASGTDSLLIALMALGISPGDEVVTTPFSFIATAEVIALLGAKPVFVDIEPRTYNLDPAQLEAAIGPNTKAIMPVSLYGQCADFDAINAIAARHALPVIEDAAQSFGATYKGRRSCALSTVGSTSFFPSKPLGAYGEGGALFTDDDALAKLMREIRLHGQDRRYHHPRLGINGRMHTLQAAVLLAKLDRFAWEVERRAAIGARYTALLQAAAATVQTPHIETWNTSVYAQYTIEAEHRDAVCERLNAGGVPTAVHYPIPLHLQPAFAQFGYGAGSCPVAEAAAARVLSLPMHPDLDAATQERIVSAVAQTLR